MKVLVINCGSSSLKYQLFDMADESVLAKGLVERIGLGGAKLIHEPVAKNNEEFKVEADIPNHEVAIELVLDALLDPEHGVVADVNEINSVGHRVVHGGEDFASSVLIDDAVMKALNDNISLAPLHNPPNIMGIEACQKLMPGIQQVAVFDTAFHQTMPPKAYMYGLPYEYYQKYRIRRYGFHGTSHKYVAERAAVMLGKPLNEIKLVSCHLGNGASITAIHHGESVETSMGFTPLEGLMMGTRSGDLDPHIVSFLIEKEQWSAEEASNFFNKQCGVLGVSGVSSDFRDIEAAAKEGNERAQLALDRFAHNVKKYIGSYMAIMNGADAVIFTAGLGENSALMRANICGDMDALGIEVDAEKNAIRGIETDVSTDAAKVRTLVIPTNEELMIARDTIDIVGNL